MRKLSVSTLVTLDCVMQDAGGFGEKRQAGGGNAYFTDDARLTGTKTLTYVPASPAEADRNE